MNINEQSITVFEFTSNLTKRPLGELLAILDKGKLQDKVIDYTYHQVGWNRQRFVVKSTVSYKIVLHAAMRQYNDYLENSRTIYRTYIVPKTLHAMIAPLMEDHFGVKVRKAVLRDRKKVEVFATVQEHNEFKKELDRRSVILRSS